jgi:anti-sigma factor RsiW
MKIDHITTRAMEKFCGGLLTMSEVIAYSEHLDSCDECNRLHDSISKVITCVKPLTLEAARDAWHIGDHPEAEELADFAAGDLDEEDTEIIEAHLANCPRCRVEVDDYAAFIKSIEPEMSISFRPQSAFERRWRTLGREFSKLPVFLPVTIAALLLTALAILAYQAYFDDETTSPITRDQPGNLVSPPSSPLPSVTATPDRTPLQSGVDQ